MRATWSFKTQNINSSLQCDPHMIQAISWSNLDMHRLAYIIMMVVPNWSQTISNQHDNPNGVGEYQMNGTHIHYNVVIMSTMVSQITSLTIVYSSVYSGTDERKDQSSTSLAFFLGIHLWLMNSPHKGPAQRASNVKNVSVWWCHHENYH